MSGRYATERQALDDVRDIDDASIDDAARRSRDRGTMQRLSAERLTAAREAAGVELGEYDGQTPRWLAGFDTAAGSGLRRDHPSRRSRRLSCSRTSDHLNRYCPPGVT